MTLCQLGQLRLSDLRTKTGCLSGLFNCLQKFSIQCCTEVLPGFEFFVLDVVEHELGVELGELKDPAWKVRCRQSSPGILDLG